MCEMKMRMNRPASWWADTWREGTPIGNGLHGALVYGAAANERIMLTHTYLWREKRQPEMPDVSDVLPKMRELILAGKMPEADGLIVAALRERGYEPHDAYPFPACDIRIDHALVDGFSHYSRELNMSRAESVVEYFDGDEKVVRRAFVSRSDDVVVIETEADAEIDLSLHYPDSGRQTELPKNAKKMRNDASDGGKYILFTAEIDSQSHGAAAKVTCKNGRKLIVVRLFTDGEPKEKLAELTAYIDALPNNYDVLMERHQTTHRELFESCEFSLDDDTHGRDSFNSELLDAAFFDENMPNALAERMWAYGRYLFVCGTAENGLPCPLMGLWSGEYRAFWAFNMANINLEMIYWNALPGNLESLVTPVFDYYEEYMDDLEDNARKMFGCGGILLSAVTTPHGQKASCMAPHIMNWTAGAGWIAQLYTDYWKFTGDKDFLAERALPFLRKTAEFYEDFLVWDKSRTKWTVIPSVSPENHTSSYRGGDEPADGCQTSINAAMDIAIIKEVFSGLADLSLICENSATADDIARWTKFLSGAPEYEFNEFNAPREWMHEDYPDRDEHRHQSHLYPVFPGVELAKKSREITEKYRNGALKRLSAGLAHQSSWSHVLNSHTFSRCNDGQNALKCLSLVAKTCTIANLFTLHNDWRDMGGTLQMQPAPFQIDAIIGFTSAVQEMLIFSDVSRVDILPALPAEWKKGNIKNVSTRAGAAISVNWDNGNCIYTVTAKRDCKFELHLADDSSKSMSLKAGQSIAGEFSL